MKIDGLLVDLDGVVRHWRNEGATMAEEQLGIAPGTIARLAYGPYFDLAHHGVYTHKQWLDHVTEVMIAEHGSHAVAAVEVWQADRGEVDDAMVDVLKDARSQGLKVGVLTNNTDILLDDLKLHGIFDLFDVVVNSAELGVIKPSPIAYQQAAERLGMEPSRIFFTDDREENVIAARFVGMHAAVFMGAPDLKSHLLKLNPAIG